jgi:flagellar biosynthesis protein FlhG
MKTLAEMTHYEVLEVEPEASSEDLERAYRLACVAYSEDSLATYSIFEEGDSSALRERIEMAYRVLADPEHRRLYDVSLGVANAGASEIDIALDLAAEQAIAMQSPADLSPEVIQFDELEEDDATAIDGAWLRRSRLRCGVEIDQIAKVTKINPTYLRFIEEERFADLPAPVYVRGFVTAYARCIGLDAERIVPEYMKRLEGARPAEPRRRERGGR